MSAAGPRIWRIISRDLSSPSLLNRTAPEASAPLQRILRPPLFCTKTRQSIQSRVLLKARIVAFSTTGIRAAQISIQPTRIPVPPKDATFKAPRFTQISSATAKLIFGPNADVETSNRILRNLQEQRVTGTLDEGIPNVKDSTLSQGLEWLRSNYHVNEDAAIIKRLEREEAQENERLIDRAEQLGIYKPEVVSEQRGTQARNASQDTVTYTPQQDPERNRVLGTSLLDKKRHANEAAYKAELEVKRAEQRAAEAEAIRIGKPLQTAETQAVVRRQKIAEDKKARLEDVQNVFGEKGNSWPAMTLTQRLWPSAVFMAAVIGLSVLFATHYTPPPKQARLWPDVPPAAATVLVLIGMNVAVFLAWRVVPLQRTLYKYFINVAGYPRAFAIIGSTFSHQTKGHLAMNMIMLWVFGTKLHDDIGRGPFIAIYLACGAFSSFFSLFAHVYKAAFHSGALGASGALAGITSTWCVINSDRPISLPFLPTEWSTWFTPWVFLALLIVGDLVFLRKGTLAKPVKGIDYVAHLGGYMGGIVAGIDVKKRLPLRRRQNRPLVKDAGERAIQELP